MCQRVADYDIDIFSKLQGNKEGLPVELTNSFSHFR